MPVITAAIATYRMQEMTQRAEDAERHVPLRIARFERRGRGRIEADIREEDDRGAAA